MLAPAIVGNISKDLFKSCGYIKQLEFGALATLLDFLSFQFLLVSCAEWVAASEVVITRAHPEHLR